MAYLATPEGDNAKKTLEKQGFTFPRLPDETVELPADVSELGSEELMALFSIFTSWADYAHAQVGLAVISERSAERRLEVVEAEAWRSLPAKSSVSASKALIVLDPMVQAARSTLDECYAYRRLVATLADHYERDAAVLSRELTRRTAESGPKALRKERWSS